MQGPEDLKNGADEFWVLSWAEPEDKYIKCYIKREGHMCTYG